MFDMLGQQKHNSKFQISNLQIPGQEQVQHAMLFVNYSFTPLLLYSSIPPLLYSSTPLLLYSSTSLRLCSSIPPLLYSSNPLRHNSSTPPLLYSSTLLLLYASAPLLLHSPIGSVEVKISIYCCSADIRIYLLLDNELDKKIDVTAILFLLVQNRQQTHD